MRAMLARVVIATTLVFLPLIVLAAPSEVCQKLTSLSGPSAENVIRVETQGLSFIIPSSMAREVLDNPDSEGYAWKSDSLEIIYSSGTLRSVDPRELEQTGCNIPSGSDVHRVLLIESDKDSLVAVFPDIDDVVRYHAIKVESPNRELQLRVLRMSLQSTKYVNRLDRLLIKEIATDLQSFRYQNEIGDLRTGKVGEIITRDAGRVERIDTCGIHLLEMIPNGEGGYLEERRFLAATNCGG